MVAQSSHKNWADTGVPNPREHHICMCNLYRLRPGPIPVARCLCRVGRYGPPEETSRKEVPSIASVVVRSGECSMESRMHRSRNAAMTCPWPAQCLVGDKGKRYAERHQESRIHFIHHGTPTHSQHQCILGRGFRARQGIINEWLRRNLNGCKVRTRMCCPAQAGGCTGGATMSPFGTFRTSPSRAMFVSRVARTGSETRGGPELTHR